MCTSHHNTSPPPDTRSKKKRVEMPEKWFRTVQKWKATPKNHMDGWDAMSQVRKEWIRVQRIDLNATSPVQWLFAATCCRNIFCLIARVFNDFRYSSSMWRSFDLPTHAGKIKGRQRSLFKFLQQTRWPGKQQFMYCWIQKILEFWQGSKAGPVIWAGNEANLFCGCAIYGCFFFS